MGTADRRHQTATATLPDPRPHLSPARPPAAGFDVIVQGRNVEIPDHFRIHVAERLSRVEKFDHKIIRIDVELFHERNPRQNANCQRVEITCRSRGPVVRAEACADDFYKALDKALDKLERRFRHAADRRRVHHGRRTPASTASAMTDVAEPLAEPISPAGPPEVEDLDGPGRVVRRKQHDAVPMTVDEALMHMELVGHDFYLFSDAESGCASVVYRRHAYDYGLINLG